jgi:hypothetical protein
VHRLENWGKAVFKSLTEKEELKSIAPASSSYLSATKFIDESVKLLRRKGNRFGHAIGALYQKWCRLFDKHDSLKGLTRLRGVRTDAATKNAKPLLMSKKNSLDEFWKWFDLQKSRQEDTDNALVKKVKTGFNDERVIKQLWLISIVHEGYLCPMMYAINEKDSEKDMYSMRRVVWRTRSYLNEWSKGENLEPLLNGWLVGHLGVVSDYLPPIDDLMCAAYDWLDPTTQQELAKVSERTACNIN